MNDNKIRKKIKELSKLYMDISIHQIIALYEEEINCNEEVYENEDEKIEKIYKCINKIRDEQINENKTIDLIVQYLNYEEKQKIIESANDMAREMSEGTKEYADNILAEVEDTMATLMGNMEAAQATVNSALATIKNNRNELK